MEKKTKYSIQESPLFRLGSKEKLAIILKIPKKEMVELSKIQPYVSFTKFVGEKAREIDTPRKKLKQVQTRIKVLLSRIETPDWLFSGKKGFSYIDNARFHLPASYVITCDIKSFYPSCTKERIFQIFKYTFEVVDDVAWILANLLSFRERIPTGSPSSQIIAFWAYYPTFMRIHNKVINQGAKISLYVDDITISSNFQISKDLIEQIKNELEKVDHTIKNSKTKYYGNDEFKLITGVAISPEGELKVPNKRREKLQNSLKKVVDEKNYKSIIGQIRSSQMIESDYSEETLGKVLEKKYL